MSVIHAGEVRSRGSCSRVQRPEFGRSRGAPNAETQAQTSSQAQAAPGLLTHVEWIRAALEVTMLIFGMAMLITLPVLFGLAAYWWGSDITQPWE